MSQGFVINPADEQYDDSNRTKWATPGRKVIAGLGFERWEASTGTPMVTVRFVVLEDLEGSGDEGAHLDRGFAVTQKAAVFLAKFARAMGYTKPFNPADDESMRELLGNGYCIATVEMEHYSKRDGSTGSKSSIRYFDDFTGDEDPNWEALIAAGEEQWESYLEWREKNPRGSRGTSSKSSGSYASKGSGSQSNMPYEDDDIPF